MKISIKNSLLLIFVIFAISGIAKDAPQVSNEEISNAKNRAADIVNKITPGNVGVADMRRTPDLSNVNLGQTSIETDPFVIAERERSKSKNLVVNPNQSDETDLIVFVSFSMPESSLNRLAVETAKAGGVLVLRGFVNDSLKQTIVASERMTNLGAQIQINPELFKTFDVQRVPTFIISKNGSNSGACSSKVESQCINHLKLEGDASLKQVLYRMANEKSSIASIAEEKLNRLEGLLP